MHSRRRARRVRHHHLKAYKPMEIYRLQRHRLMVVHQYVWRTTQNSQHNEAEDTLWANADHTLVIVANGD